jgi:molybdopterin-guanine dinucleotide biosynthesis protein A
VRKTLLQVDGRSIVERIFDALAPLADECLALVHDTDLTAVDGLQLIVDQRPYAGPLPALLHGLSVADGETCMLVAGDMPFVSPAAFTYLLRLQATEQARVVVPFVDGYIESMHAVLARREVLEALQAAASAGEQRLFRVYQSLKPRLVGADELRAVDPYLHTLFNVDSPEDLALAEQIARRRERSRDRSRPA